MTDQTTIFEAPAEEAGITYLNDVPRSQTVVLKHPFKIGEQEFREVTVRRLSGYETKAYGAAVATFWRRVQLGTDVPPEPLFPGIGLPREAFPALDDEDMVAIEDAADRFFPERLRPMLEALNGLMVLGMTHATGASEPAS